MRPIALDTNAYAAFKRGDEQIVAVLQHAPVIIVCVTVLGELLGGFAAGQRESHNRSELTQFLNTPRVKVVPGTTATADLYALVYAACAAKASLFPPMICGLQPVVFGAWCRLLTFDVHFQNIDGLSAGARLEDFIRDYGSVLKSTHDT